MNKRIEDIENSAVREEIKKLSKIFKDSFINGCNEFIAILELKLTDVYDSYEYVGKRLVRVPKRPIWINLYFNLYSNIETKNDVKAKVLEYFSRACHKSSYASENTDELIHRYISKCVNEYLGTQFTDEDFSKIYCKLGNGVNRTLALKFIESGYNMTILEVE